MTKVIHTLSLPQAHFFEAQCWVRPPGTPGKRQRRPFLVKETNLCAVHIDPEIGFAVAARTSVCVSGYPMIRFVAAFVDDAAGHESVDLSIKQLRTRLPRDLSGTQIVFAGPCGYRPEMMGAARVLGREPSFFFQSWPGLGVSLQTGKIYDSEMIFGRGKRCLLSLCNAQSVQSHIKAQDERSGLSARAFAHMDDMIGLVDGFSVGGDEQVLTPLRQITFGDIAIPEKPKSAEVAYYVPLKPCFAAL